jgi:hypothetical protein
MGAVIKFLIGISIFIILAGCGFPLVAQIYLWLGTVALFVVSAASYANISMNWKRLDNKEELLPETVKILPVLYSHNIDVLSAHSLCGNIMTAIIAFYLLPVIMLPIAVLVAMAMHIVSLQHTKEFLKHVKNDSRYQQ